MSMSFRLCSFAPRTRKTPRSSSRRSGTAIARRPEANRPVTDFLLRATFAAVPSATTSPPCSPVPGAHVDEPVAAAHAPTPTTTVLPRSRSASSVARSARVVALVQPDRRLVEDVEHAGEPRADLRRQADALPSPPESVAAPRSSSGSRRRRRSGTCQLLADLLVIRWPISCSVRSGRAIARTSAPG